MSQQVISPQDLARRDRKMLQCLRGLQKMDSMLFLCFVYLKQGLARVVSEFWWIQAVLHQGPKAGILRLILLIQMPNIHCQFLCVHDRIMKVLVGLQVIFVRALRQVVLRVVLKLVLSIRAQSSLFISMFGVPATSALLWKVCGEPVAMLWDNRRETTEMGFLSHRNKLPVLTCECTDKAIPRTDLEGIQMRT